MGAAGPLQLPLDPAAVGRAVFGRVLCGVDGSEHGLEAVRQAALVLAPGGRLVLASVCESHLALRAGVHVVQTRRDLEAAAHRALAQAQALAPEADLRLVRGRANHTLLELAAAEAAGLVAVGSQGFGRGVGIALGSLPTRLLHDAPCAVLVARARTDGEARRLSRGIAAGIDGSPASLAAAAAAADLGRRLDVPVRYLVASGGKPVDVDGLAATSYELEFTPWRPVEALVGVSNFVDAVVVGSRGLHGVAALGSVSERVAHRARSSVLVVR
jgi:nucleotide-binding universal stress UspA family protein